MSKFIRINYFWFTNNDFLTAILLIPNEIPKENYINMLTHHTLRRYVNKPSTASHCCRALLPTSHTESVKS